MSDILNYTSDGDWIVYYSTGHGLYPQDISGLCSGNVQKSYNLFKTCEVNGDGKSDLLVIGLGANNPGPDNRPSYHYAVSNGNGFDPLVRTGDVSYNIQIANNTAEKIHVVDINGDGISDIIEKSNTTNHIHLASGDLSNRVKYIVNGLNHKIGFKYKPLTDDKVYKKGRSSNAYPIINYIGPSYVVSSFTSDNGSGGTFGTSYTYENAKIHRLGRGYLGFLNRSIKDWQTGFRTYEKFHLNTDHLFKELKLVTLLTYDWEVISLKTYTNQVEEFEVSIFPYVSSIVVNDYVHNSEKTVSYSYDDYGNMLTMQQNTGTYAETITNTYINSGTFCPASIQNSSISRRRKGNTETFDKTVYYTYNSNGDLESVTDFYGLAKAVKKEYVYGPLGLVTSETISADSETDRTVTNAYDTRGRFLTSKSNSLGHSIAYSHDAVSGQVSTFTDANGNVTQMKYNAFGQLVGKVLPDGNEIEVNMDWCDNSSPENALFYTETKKECCALSTAYYDILGRTIRDSKIGFDGTEIYRDVIYNSRGKVSSASSYKYRGLC